MNRLTSTVAALMFSCGVGAETLKADAIVCETEAPLALLSVQGFTNQPGSRVMEGVSAAIQSFSLSQKFNQTLLDLANREQEIWRDSRTPNRGATASRAEQARAAQREAAEEQKRYSEFASRCAATPPKEQPATVLERRPISKALRVKTMLKGAEHELWTHEFYVRTE